MKKLDLVLAWVLVVMGFVHCGVAILHIGGLSREGIWFFAGGVAIVECGFLNVLRNSGGRGVVKVASIIGNILLLLVVIAVSILLIGSGRLLTNPQAIITLLVTVAETLFSIA